MNPNDLDSIEGQEDLLFNVPTAVEDTAVTANKPQVNACEQEPAPKQEPDLVSNQSSLAVQQSGPPLSLESLSDNELVIHGWTISLQYDMSQEPEMSSSAISSTCEKCKLNRMQGLQPQAPQQQN